MRVTRCFVDQPLAVGAPCTLPESTTHHLTKVLRHDSGAAIVLFNGGGGEYRATLGERTGKTATAHIDAFEPATRESPLATILFQALSKGDRVDTAVQKSTELGVTEIVLIDAERSTLKLKADRLDKKIAHWRGIAISAAEQSGRTRIPNISVAPTLPSVDPGVLAMIFAPDAPPGAWAGDAPEQVWVAVGPEGGFSEQELENARQNRWQPTRIGPRVLRTETAGPAVIATAQALWGDWGGGL